MIDHLRRFYVAHSPTFSGSGGRSSGDNLGVLPQQPFDHVWFWRSRLPERKGQRCRVLARGAMNSVLVEFEDGTKTVTSRYAVREAGAGRSGDERLRLTPELDSGVAEDVA